jgi:uncharacterized peroxidase-related enzyme
MSDPREGFVIEPASMEKVQELFPELLDALGWLPNSLRIMARDPELLEAVGALGKLISYRPGKVEPGLKWLVGHVASRAAGCRYCTAHSVMAAEVDGVSVEKIEAVWTFETSPLFDDAERAALRWARAAGSSPNEVTRENYDELHLYFDDDQIVEMASMIALYGWFNRWNDTFLTPLENEPLAFGKAHLEPSGWEPGRHVPAST